MEVIPECVVFNHREVGEEVEFRKQVLLRDAYSLRGLLLIGACNVEAQVMTTVISP